MLLIVMFKNNKPWKLTIDPNQTLLNLKKEITSHYELINKEINIKCGTEIYDNTNDSKTLSELNIAKLVQVVKVYDPGFSLHSNIKIY